jgi:N-acyl-D-aspartate/D-glutamate deacylase
MTFACAQEKKKTEQEMKVTPVTDQNYAWAETQGIIEGYVKKITDASGTIGGIPQFRFKGRLQVGADADIVVFNPNTVTDNATYKAGEGALPTTGIPYVVVNGVPVVKDSKVQKGVYPGQAIRFPVSPKGKLDEIEINPRIFKN